MGLIARYLQLCLTVAALSVASLATGHARGQTPVADTIVICRGLHVVVISVDAEGNETTVQQTCPDAIAKLAVPLDAPVSASHPTAWTQATRDLAAQNLHDTREDLTNRARSPPISV